MTYEYGRKAPLIRFACVTAALSITMSVGLFIDFLATTHTPYAAQAPQKLQHPVMIASR